MKSIIDERKLNTLRASQVTRLQDAQIQQTLNGMSNEEIENMLDSNPDLVDFMSVGADTNNDGIVVNYSNQPDKQKEDISIIPPWEANFSTAGQQQGRVNLFQVGSNPASGMSFGNPVNYYGGFGYNQNDERLQKYTNGMKLYNINPYAFVDAQQMIDYYNYCEKQREFAQNQQYYWIHLMERFSNDENIHQYAESLKFKPADKIYEERMKMQEMIQKQNKDCCKEEDNNIVYGGYNGIGVRYMRVASFKIIDNKSGEVIKEVNFKKDKKGQSYIAISRARDQKIQYENNKRIEDIMRYRRYCESVSRALEQNYVYNKNRWAQWAAEGLSVQEQWARYEDERIDWKKQEQLIDRALRTITYSKDTFSKILSACCDTSLTYAGKSKVFSLSYDFERDLHYKSLISTPEEMDSDPMVHQKLENEYNIKRAKFMDKVLNHRFGCNMKTNIDYVPSVAKPNISTLTLEDFNKPENQVMYTRMSNNPDLSTDNLFIPPELSGGVIPTERTMGIMTVDDDTGEVVSQFEEKIDMSSGFSKIGQLNDEELNANF